MFQPTILSPAEHKILLGLALFVCLLFYLHLSNAVIESHNASVKSAQIEKQFEADYGRSQTSMFSHCEFMPPLYIYLFWIQFYTAPLSYFLLRKQRFGRFAFSILMTLTTTLSLWAWNYRNYSGYLLNDLYWLHEYGYFHLASNLSAFVLAIVSSVFLVLQFYVLVRFAAEKFQAKISLR
jgi:hypothetical protein